MLDSHPISQKPYRLLINHVVWVLKELDILEKGSTMNQSVLPWASLIAVIQIWTIPGELPRRFLFVYNRALNKLLPPVTKAKNLWQPYMGTFTKT